MAKKNNTKLVFVGLHGDTFRELLFYWLSYHPRLKWWRSGEGLSCESVTMSESAWRNFCRDFDFKFADL